MSLLEGLLIGIERHAGRVLIPAIREHRYKKADRQAPHASEPPAGTWWAEDSRWSREGRQPSQRNRVTPVLDGEAFLSRLHSCLLAAHSYVLIAGWCLTPHVPLLRKEPEDLIETQLLSILSQVAQRVPVRILLWGGAPAIIQPTTRMASGVARLINEHGHGDLVCRLDKTAQWSHSHHQKAIVIDGQQAFVGGMDLTTFAGDRWDIRNHDLRAGVNWHDTTVLIEGEAVADVEANFRERWQAVTGDTSLPQQVDPDVDPGWRTPAQVVRTIPAGDYAFAKEGEFGIQHAYLELIRRAEDFIYLESQYLWAPEVMDALVEAMDRPRSKPFRIVIVLPARATSGKWDNDKHVDALRRVDRGRHIVEVYSLFTSGPTTGAKPFRYRPVYVHSKAGVIDDEWLIVGSANLNERGMQLDSELDVLVHDREVARRTRLDLWSEHLAMPEAALEGTDPTTLIDTLWRQHATGNARLMNRADRPLQSSVHFYVTGKTPGAWLLEESEALTFEH